MFSTTSDVELADDEPEEDDGGPDEEYCVLQEHPPPTANNDAMLLDLPQLGQECPRLDLTSDQHADQPCDRLDADSSRFARLPLLDLDDAWMSDECYFSDRSSFPLDCDDEEDTPSSAGSSQQTATSISIWTPPLKRSLSHDSLLLRPDDDEGETDFGGDSTAASLSPCFWPSELADVPLAQCLDRTSKLHNFAGAVNVDQVSTSVLSKPKCRRSLHYARCSATTATTWARSLVRRRSACASSDCR